MTKRHRRLSRALFLPLLAVLPMTLMMALSSGC